MTTPTTTSGIERLLRRIAPGDIGGHPLYVLFESELPAKYRPPSYVWGLHGPCLDLSLRGRLASEGRWRGRGPAVILNDLAIAKEASELAGDDADLVAELYNARMVATVTHEAGHMLERPLDLLPPPAEIEQEIQTTAEKALTRTAATTESEADAPSDLPHWAGHDSLFIRSLVHAHARAERIVGRIPGSLVFPHRRYQLSPLERYRHTLEREIASFDGCLSFCDLRTTRPPTAFVELWKSDLRCWWESTGDRTEALTAYVAALRPYVHPAG